MIKIERENDLTRLSAAVTDFSESLGYCQYKIPLSMRGAKSETSVALVKGAIAHRDEEMFEQEHVQLEPVTTEQVQDRKSTRLNSSHVSESRMPSSA